MMMSRGYGLNHVIPIGGILLAVDILLCRYSNNRHDYRRVVLPAKVNYVVNAVFSLLKDTLDVGSSNVDIIDVEITKAVVAIALLLKGNTQNILASDLESQLVCSVETFLDQEKPQIEDIIIATLLVSCSALTNPLLIEG